MTNAEPNVVLLYTDGGARPNPGPAAVAFLILDENGNEVVIRGISVGVASNNMAEYLALIAGLAACLRVTAGPVHWISDSQLVVRQIGGEYRVLEPQLQPLYAIARHLTQQFAEFIAEHRSRNDPNLKRVDELVRRTRDAAATAESNASGRVPH